MLRVARGSPEIEKIYSVSFSESPPQADLILYSRQSLTTLKLTLLLFTGYAQAKATQTCWVAFFERSCYAIIRNYFVSIRLYS